jgi:hypothetical protein
MEPWWPTVVCCCRECVSAATRYSGQARSLPRGLRRPLALSGSAPPGARPHSGRCAYDTCCRDICCGSHLDIFTHWVHLAQWLDRMAYVPEDGSSKLSARRSVFLDFWVFIGTRHRRGECTGPVSCLPFEVAEKPMGLRRGEAYLCKALSHAAGDKPRSTQMRRLFCVPESGIT